MSAHSRCEWWPRSPRSRAAVPSDARELRLSGSAPSATALDSALVRLGQWYGRDAVELIAMGMEYRARKRGEPFLLVTPAPVRAGSPLGSGAQRASSVACRGPTGMLHVRRLA